MSWIVGNTTLKRPSKYEPIEKEVSTTHEMIDGTHKKDFVRRYIVHELTLSALTQTELNALIAEYEKHQALSFSVSDGSRTISSRLVFLEIKDRKHSYRGSEFREDVVIHLIEV